MATELKDEEDQQMDSDILSASSDEEDDVDFPIFLILTTGLWCMLYAVFSFGFANDPDTCVVSNKDDLIAVQIPVVDDSETIKDKDSVDVAARFKFFFDSAFLISCFQLGIGMVGLIVRNYDSFIKSIAINLFWLANLLIFLLWFYVFVVRYMHSGSECSGDFIVGKKEAKNLLIVQGMFVKFSSLLIFFVMLLLCCGHFLNCF